MPPRWALLLKALLWRAGMSIGMFIHRLTPPRPSSPDFRISIPTSTAPTPGTIDLLFYLPPTYTLPTAADSLPLRWRRRSRVAHLGLKGSPAASPTTSSSLITSPASPTISSPDLFPAVLNFHGGGFTLGGPADDARWCTFLAARANCVVVSASYRRAPTHPFPTAVQDAQDALRWVRRHASTLGLDGARVSASGFSAGANLCFAAALGDAEGMTGKADEDVEVDGGNVGADGEDGKGSAEEGDEQRLKAIIAWYPSLDYTRSRAQRRATNPGGPDASLSQSLTALFDESYLYPPERVRLDDPLLSPARASDEVLRAALPREMCLFTCEHDMLYGECEEFRARLTGLGFNVGGRVVRSVGHGWDKRPTGWNRDGIAERVYEEAARALVSINTG